MFKPYNNYMKKYLSINLTFTLSLTALLILSSKPAAYAQKRKELKQTIIINNGDTTINGIKLSETDDVERQRLRKDFKEMERNITIKRKKGKNGEVIISNRGKEPKVLHWKDLDDSSVREFHFDDKDHDRMRVFEFNGDSMMINLDTLVNGGFRFRMDGPDSSMHKRMMGMNKNFKFEISDDLERVHPRMFIDGSDFSDFGMSGRNNSQSFNYTNTDKDGITSRINIRISEPNHEMLKKITANETSTTSLEVADLTLFPNFSTGKMTLSFNLDKRGTTDIKILDSDLKPVFTDKPTNFSSNYTKQIMLPKNGIYYITVNQNGNWFVRKLVKE